MYPGLNTAAVSSDAAAVLREWAEESDALVGDGGGDLPQFDLDEVLGGRIS